MHQGLRLCFLALYGVGPVVALLAVLRRGRAGAASQEREQSWRWYVPPVLLPLEWLLPPALVLLGFGEVQADWLPLRLLGLAFALCGVALLAWAAVALGRFLVHEAAILPGHALVTSG